MKLISYGCSTAAGAGKKNFWNQLSEGRAQITALESLPWKWHREDPEPLPSYQVHWRTDLSSSLSQRARLGEHLKDSWQDLLQDAGENKKYLEQDRVGVILASTKGFIEDVIWNPSATPIDTLTPLLEDFLAIAKIKASQTSVVSSACASAAAAMKLAQSWLNAKSVDHVLVVSADSVGEFVLRGFHSLQAVTPHKEAQPFDKDRAGLQLGEAGAILWLSQKLESDLEITGVGLHAEGIAATRPDSKGRSLFHSLTEAVGNFAKPSLILAHGTGTGLNDATEDVVFKAFYNYEPAPWITGTKWSVGHTLGVSCALDVIAASEVLKNQFIFPLSFLKTVDPEFKGRYVQPAVPLSLLKVGSSALVSSLGFGGVHGAVHLIKGGDQ